MIAPVLVPEYRFGEIFVASAPVTATVALVLALLLHRLLVKLHFYRWVWHPVLFDTALFVAIWALLVRYPQLINGWL